MRETDTQRNELWWSNWSSHWVTDWSSHSHKPLVRLITYIGFGFLSLVFVHDPFVTGFHICANTLLLQNWSRQEINRKWVIQMIRVIVRILLLPWIQWIMIQVIERYETNMSCYHLIITGHILGNKQNNKHLCIHEIMQLIILKIKTKMKIDPRKYDINRPRSREGHKYSKYMKRLSIMMLICIEQHLSNVWSSVYENVKQHWVWVEKKRYL